MVTIGGKTRVKKPTQPQYVVQLASHLNQYAVLDTDETGHLHVNWIGDPNAATKFDSKYQAKYRIREIENVPESRCFKQLGEKHA
jgi:hypothetical protein